MFIKRTPKNQITLPEEVLTGVDSAEYFAVTVEGGRIILTPVSIHQADAIRLELEQLGITEQDVQDAIAWARQ